MSGELMTTDECYDELERAREAIDAACKWLHEEYGESWLEIDELDPLFAVWIGERA